MIKIEVLYPEYANLYGDTGNIRYLANILEEVEIVYTNINEEPKFMSQKIDMIYLGPTTESAQEEIANKLIMYKEKIKELIDIGISILAIGNSLELFGKHIEKLDGSKISGLEIFDVYSKRVANYRHNDLILGTSKEGIEIVGFKNQMSHTYGQDKNYFLEVSFGSGRNIKEKTEGIRYKNFIGTYVIGPILPLNPGFTSVLINNMGGKEKASEIQQEAKSAYEIRVEEYKNLMRK